MTFFAHSGRSDCGIPPQLYAEHAVRVREGGFDRAHIVGRYMENKSNLLEEACAKAGEFHDLGKLHPANQEILGRIAPSSKRLPFPHADAGSAALLKSGFPEDLVAGLLCYSHHAGLPSFPVESLRREAYLRDTRCLGETDKNLGVWLEQHRREVRKRESRPGGQCGAPSREDKMFFRFALSCLADADHSDTARHYGKESTIPEPQIHPSERFKALKSYVAALGRNRTDDRAQMRTRIFNICSSISLEEKITACDSPVGTGKTTAVMAHLLSVAAKRNLRRIFVVLPFTNIIDQAVGVYRKSVVLPGENPEEVIQAHHHRMEYGNYNVRYLAERWKSPVVITTAVRFFETLSSSSPAVLRNLHQLAGSAIFIDEAHAALPAGLWPQGWSWLKELASSWGCHIVLGSGSLARFWELPEFDVKPPFVPELLPREVYGETLNSERQRVRFQWKKQVLNLGELVSFALEQPGPRLLIMNTVQSAAVVARFMEKSHGKNSVEHLSTALTPFDRHQSLKRVKRRLSKGESDSDWILVATSCVEAGMDFSFRTGFREMCALTSLLQTAGRVNRESEFGTCDIWSFETRKEDGLNWHPQFELSTRILKELFEEGKVDPEMVSEALRREIRQRPIGSKSDEIKNAERERDFPKVDELFKVIDSSTVTVLVNQELVLKIENGEEISTKEIQKYSVQIWSNRINDLCLRKIEALPEFWAWTLTYDDFLGYMKGVLESLDVKAGQPLVI
jgi:CRISPR-associated endonuclease/helicase Cas3